MSSNRVRIPLLALLCAAVFAQAWLSLRTKSLTYDELTYIPTGYSYVVTGDYRLNPEHPPLAKLLAGAAILPLAPRLDLSHPGWRQGEQWSFGAHFFETAGVDTAWLVSVARLPTVLMTMVLVVVAYLMAREVYGPRAGLLAAGLCAFSPNLLAHGRLATTDFGQALLLLATAWAFLRFVRSPSAARGIGVGVALGLALLTKYSAILLLPLLGLWAGAAAVGWGPGIGSGGVRGPGTEPGEERPEHPSEGAVHNASEGAVGGMSESALRRAGFLGVSVLGMVVIAAFVVSLGYQTPGDPTAFVRNLGTLYTNVHRDLPPYFAGRFHHDGLPWYFVAAFLLKAPLAFLALLGLRVGDQLRRRGPGMTESLYLLLPAVLWFVAMTVSALPLGIRYVLPAYPLLFVYVAGIAESPLVRRRWGAVVVTLLAGAFALSSLRAFPHYIPYFNALAGGPSRGIEWLDDSNVDWGQDLPLLARWLEERDIRDATLVPMARYDPALYGVEGDVVPPGVAIPILQSPDPEPGVYAVSAHLLARVRWRGAPEIDPLRDLTPRAVLGHSIYVFVIPPR